MMRAHESRKARVIPRYRARYVAVQRIPKTLHMSTVGDSIINKHVNEYPMRAHPSEGMA